VQLTPKIKCKFKSSMCLIITPLIEELLRRKNCYYVTRQICFYHTTVRQGREPSDAMSLRYADIEPPRFARQTEPPLCRPSLHYADQASTMQTKPPPCRSCLCYAVNEPSPYSTYIFKSWFLCVIKNVHIFF